METLGKITFSLIGIVLITLLRGVIISNLWGWFVVPLDVLPLGYVQAMGLSILISVFVFRANKRDDEKSPIEMIVEGVFLNLALWGIGAIIHLFM